MQFKFLKIAFESALSQKLLRINLFESLTRSTYSDCGWYETIFDPHELAYSIDGDDDSGSIYHPITKAPIDRLTLELSYANKQAIGRFEEPALYQAHADNPKAPYFDIFDRLKDLAGRKKKKRLNKRYFQRKKKKIKASLSREKKIRALVEKIRVKKLKITKSRAEQTNLLRFEKRELTFSLATIKKNIAKRRENKRTEYFSEYNRKNKTKKTLLKQKSRLLSRIMEDPANQKSALWQSKLEGVLIALKGVFKSNNDS